MGVEGVIVLVGSREMLSDFSMVVTLPARFQEHLGTAQNCLPYLIEARNPALKELLRCC